MGFQPTKSTAGAYRVGILAHRDTVDVVIGWDNTTHRNAVGDNLLYFNNFLFRPVGRFGGLESPPY
ncbi:MAG: hypothetical protein IKX14_05290, partial [Neisseriaceae bacterium]|nr:hypothetical protein [Neisseriaceae bacterium]